MFSVVDSIKYIGLAAIIYFLIKAFVNDKLDNMQIAFLVVCILVLIIFITNHSSKCVIVEKYQNMISDTPVASDPSTNHEDDDIRDFKEIMGIDKQYYQKIKDNEQELMNKIKNDYTNDMVYTNTHPFNTIPLGSKSDGFTYMPVEHWFRAYEKPPVCISDKKCPVCPIVDSGTEGLIEYDKPDELYLPLGINTRYIKNVLNRGKDD